MKSIELKLNRDDKELLRLSSLIFLVAISFLVIACALKLTTNNIVSNDCTVTTIAVIDSIKDNEVNRDTKKFSKLIDYTYIVNGNKYTVKNQETYYFDGYDNGDKFTVTYNPDNPSEVVIGNLIEKGEQLRPIYKVRNGIFVVGIGTAMVSGTLKLYMIFEALKKK